eukprot:m.68877 g.68877  ORF g.68877 m.68877 type:complete len:306 (-) comp24012_c0_seq2:196-1113(-)
MSNSKDTPVVKAKGSIGASSPAKGFLFSWTSVCIAESVTIPVDTVKVRMQLQGELGATQRYKNGVDAFRRIGAEEGIAGLWKGLAPALLRQSLYGTFRYGSYEPIKKSIGVDASGNCSIWKKVWAACIAGTVGSFIAVPCDLVKVRMQADMTGKRYSSTFSAFRDVFRSEGVVGMWRGASPTCSRAAVGAMTELPVYDEIKTQLIERDIVQEGLKLHLIAALSAGLFSTFWMNPFDVVKSRIMNQDVSLPKDKLKYQGVVDCLTKTVKFEGVGSLWKGFWPAYTRVGPRVVIIFVVLEQLRANFD